MASINKTTRYALFVHFENRDCVKRYISEAGAVVHTTIDSMDEPSTSEIVFEATRKQIKELKRSIYDKALIDSMCFKRTGNDRYKRIWSKSVPIYTLPPINKVKQDFGYEVQ